MAGSYSRMALEGQRYREKQQQGIVFEIAHAACSSRAGLQSELPSLRLFAATTAGCLMMAGPAAAEPQEGDAYTFIYKLK